MLASILLRSGHVPRRVSSAAVASLSLHRASANATLRSLSSITNHLGESIPEEYADEPDENEGEWMGCTRKFLAPISVNSRGSGDYHTKMD